ncbi:CDP-glycerol glycerophosphotransferase family protein [Methyloprofundus sp.]|uniref:CDP-glycerol glycerophosphotransferase family protein n=1 Tax=Methyloprofundus sp. TaxID=2020875 RepID=UPI003D0F7AD2
MGLQDLGVIDKRSPVIGKFKRKSNWLAVDSFKLIFYLYHANRIISTHGLWMIPDEFGILKKLTRKTLKAKRIMLGHGVRFIKNGRKFYHKSYFPLNDLWVTASPIENALLIKDYGYFEDDITVTGYPRFDSLIDISDQSRWNNMILYMPTFRDKEKWLQDEFKDTELYRRVLDLMNDKQLNHFLQEKDCHLAIYLHQDIQNYSKYLDQYADDRIHIMRQGDLSVTELLKMSKLLITDYSNVMFDFIYMNKPFISYHFDYQEFINGREDKPHHDVRTELPGYAVTTHDQLIDKIQTIEKDNFVLPQEYQKKAAKHFTYRDNNNCKRVYQAIRKL